MKTRFITPAMALTGLLLAPLATAATIISVNFTEFAADSSQINTDESFGIAAEGSVTNVWINQNGAVTNAGLTDQFGGTTTVAMTSTRPNAAATFGAVWSDTPIRGAVDDYTSTVSLVTINLTGLNATFSQGYKIIAYVTAYSSNTGASISDGTTTYFFKGGTDPVSPTFIQTTDTVDDGAGTAPFAQYAVFGSAQSPLTGNAVTLRLDTLYGGGSAIGGFQIVAIPEPAAALLGGLGLLALVRRRR